LDKCLDCSVLITEPIDENYVTPPPWKLGENECLDETYCNFMKELQATEWDVQITNKIKLNL